METNVICPNCGAKFAISEHEHTVSNAVVIGKDSNLGNVFLKLEDRKEQLAAHGIDASKYFSITSPTGGDVLMRWNDDGTPSKVDENDPVIVAIRKIGSVPNRRLFRRWITAQVCHGLAYYGGFTAWMKRHGYNYTWKMAIEEFRVQSVLFAKDLENYVMRNRWFNQKIASAMCKDYITQLRKHIDKLAVRHCKGMPYKHIGSRNYFLSDIESKVIAPLQNIWRSIDSPNLTPHELYRLMVNFRSHFPYTMENGFKQCREWKDAYKGSGAYFAMRNFIMFHNMNFVGCNDRNQSLMELDNYARHAEGYMMLGALKQMLKDNHVNVVDKIAEWRK